MRGKQVTDCATFPLLIQFGLESLLCPVDSLAIQEAQTTCSLGFGSFCLGISIYSSFLKSPGTYYFSMKCILIVL